MSDILIVEDETVLARSIVGFLERRGFSAEYAVDEPSAKSLFERLEPRLVILDYKLNEDDGLELLGWMRASNPRTHVVMMTGHGDVDIAVRAMKAGARDFLVKPAPLGAIAAIASELMLGEMGDGQDRDGVDRIVGRSAVANGLRAAIRRLAEAHVGTRRPGVLVMGPRGAGKMMAALALHEAALGPDAPLVTLDCGLDPDVGPERLRELIGESTGGTLVLRHVAQLRREAQNRVLAAIAVADVSIIATSERHITADESGFLPDLLYRIQVGWIDVPPLSERAVDILPIAESVARRLARSRGQGRPRFAAEARAKLLEYPWPGNVAELVNCIERAMIQKVGDVIEADHVRPINAAGLEKNAFPTLQEVELGAIRSALSRSSGNVSRAADLLGISRDTLRYRMAKFELSRR